MFIFSFLSFARLFWLCNGIWTAFSTAWHTHTQVHTYSPHNLTYARLQQNRHFSALFSSLARDRTYT